MQPIALEDIETDGRLEEGFQEASMVSEMPDAQDFEKDYQTCPDFAKIFTAVKDGKRDTEHPQYPEYYINPEGLLIFKDNQKHCSNGKEGATASSDARQSDWFSLFSEQVSSPDGSQFLFSEDGYENREVLREL